MYILVTAGTNDANPYYQVSWALYPDLAMDIIVPQLARFMDVETAGKIFFLTSQLLIVSGALALELSVKRRHEIAVFAALISLHSLPFSLGLVNFEFGTGISFGELRHGLRFHEQENGGAALLVHIIFSSILFLAHFFALGIYGLVIGIFELRRILELTI